MPYGKDWAECPRCGIKAKNKDEIEELFGYREMGDEEEFRNRTAENADWKS